MKHIALEVPGVAVTANQRLRRRLRDIEPPRVECCMLGFMGMKKSVT